MELVRGKYAAEGVKILGEARSAAPKNPAIAYHLAVALVLDQKPQEAQSLVVRILESEVEFSERTEALALLQQLKDDTPTNGGSEGSEE